VCVCVCVCVYQYLAFKSAEVQEYCMMFCHSNSFGGGLRYLV